MRPCGPTTALQDGPMEREGRPMRLASATAGSTPMLPEWASGECRGALPSSPCRLCSRTMLVWRQTAAIATRKGYKFLSTPLVAVDIGYAKKFIEHACRECQDASCGCPVYVGFHFYAFDCQPKATGGYNAFKQ